MKNFLALLLIVVYTYACKKKDSVSQTSASSATTSGTTSAVANFSGFFPLERYCSWYNGTVSFPSNPYQCKVQLYNSPVNDYTLWQSVNIGTVTINGNKLKFFSGINMYSDTVSNPYPNYATQKVIALTSTVLPSFSFTVTDNFPDYNSVNAIQINDTLKLSNTLVIPLDGLVTVDKVYCSLSTSPVSAATLLSKEVTSQVNQISFSPSELSIYTSGQIITCRLILKKYNIQTIGGKNYRFECLGYNDFYMLAQ